MGLWSQTRLADSGLGVGADRAAVAGAAAASAWLS
jgi:hypothetical protein